MTVLAIFGLFFCCLALLNTGDLAQSTGITKKPTLRGIQRKQRTLIRRSLVNGVLSIVLATIYITDYFVLPFVLSLALSIFVLLLLQSGTYLICRLYREKEEEEKQTTSYTGTIIEFD